LPIVYTVSAPVLATLTAVTVISLSKGEGLRENQKRIKKERRVARERKGRKL
jgi:hypothetical protein